MMDDMSGEGHLKAGTRLRDFEIKRVLGAGGYGVTYLACDCYLDRKVAIKEYFPHEWAAWRPDGKVEPKSVKHEEGYQRGLKRFLEARVLARLQHAHIVQVYQVFEERGTAYMVTEYVKGRSLEKALEKEGPWPEARVLDLLDKLIAGLEEVHENGLMHRDVKPANVMLREDGSPVLIDFGAARQAVGARSRPLTVILTHGYAPIEQYDKDGREQGPWTDVYALGALAYEALSGRVPQEADRREERDSLPPVSEVASQPVSTQLSSAVMSALALRRDDRPQNLAEWRAQLWPPPLPDTGGPAGGGAGGGGETGGRGSGPVHLIGALVAGLVAGLVAFVAVIAAITGVGVDDMELNNNTESLLVLISFAVGSLGGGATVRLMIRTKDPVFILAGLLGFLIYLLFYLLVGPGTNRPPWFHLMWPVTSVSCAVLGAVAMARVLADRAQRRGKSPPDSTVPPHRR